ncbi:phenylacetate-CoA oxygenase subunit PaaI [Nocardia sp. CDC159]|uniref:Phenylacetate-CoA oxygenase subunit PaaI n=1 Tax=Nocardia pulmonis TaxID=2951408 RepID=A0A9X2IYV9_9NOCA|nr:MULTISPECIES: Phenylacetic acid catabolic protein [Nocardia]MCM6774311.1 phenylacetate-CoA oxygenase subunit PaaI [Nocardia pulmonis]MCM6787623.1 phenylacetate-CoA oxygenase subunit PaaI [Nocardia sp. CDC159]
MTTADLDTDEVVVVRTPEEFHRMPRAYQKALLSQIIIHTEGEISGGDDYIQMFLPLAPDAEERQVCAERAVEEYDHYKIGKRVLAELGYDSSHMESQQLSDRTLFADSRLHTCTTWAERGIFSYFGEEAILLMMREFAQSSYRPWADAVRTIILDEKIHIAHGARVCRNLAQDEEGKQQLQWALDRLWPTFEGLFGSPTSKRAELAVKFGLRKTTNGEALELYRKQMVGRAESLGLTLAIAG